MGGLSDDYSDQEHVRLYCGNCEDVYIPPEKYMRRLNGAYFGSSFPHLFFLNVPKLLIKGDNVEEKDKKLAVQLSKKYVPQVYGYRLHKLWHSVSLQPLHQHNHDALVYGKRNEEDTKEQEVDAVALRVKVKEQEM